GYGLPRRAPDFAWPLWSAAEQAAGAFDQACQPGLGLERAAVAKTAKVVSEGLGAVVAVVRVLVETLQTDQVKPPRQVNPPARGSHARRITHLIEVRPPHSKRRTSCQHFRHDDAQGEDITRRPGPAQVAAADLRSHVCQSPRRLVDQRPMSLYAI